MKTLLVHISDNRHPDWSSGAPARALNALFADLAPLEDVWFTACDERLLGMAQQHGLRTLRLKGTFDTPTEVVKELLEASETDTLPFGLEEFVVVVDTRNPLIRLADVQEAARCSASAPYPVISMVPPVDHPYQISHMDRIVWSGLLHFRDRAFLPKAPDETFVSKPFFAPEGAVSTVDPLEIQSGSGFLPAHGGRTLSPDAAMTLFLVSAPESLRAAFPCASAPGCTVEGHGLATAERSPLFVLGEGDMLTVSVDDAHCPCTVRLIPFDATGIAGTEIRTAHVGRCATSAISAPRWEQWSGFICSLTSQGGSVNASIPFDQNGTLWKGRKNLITGEQITGRQNMPEVLVVEGSVAAGKPGELARLKEHLAKGTCVPLILNQEQQFRILTPLDVVKWISMERLSNETDQRPPVRDLLQRPLPTQRTARDTMPLLFPRNGDFLSMPEHTRLAKNMLHGACARIDGQHDLCREYVRLERFACQRDQRAAGKDRMPARLSSLEVVYRHQQGEILTPGTLGPDATFLTTVLQTGETCTLTLDGQLKRLPMDIPVMDKKYHDGQYYMLSRDGSLLLLADRQLRITGTKHIRNLGLGKAKFLAVDGQGLTLVDACERTVAFVSPDLRLESVRLLPHLEYLVCPLRQPEGVYVLNSALLPGGGEVVRLSFDGRVETVMDGLDMPLSLDVFEGRIVVADRSWVYFQPLAGCRVSGSRTKLPLRVLAGEDVAGQLIFRHPALIDGWLYYFMETCEHEDPSTYRSTLMRVDFAELTDCVAAGGRTASAFISAREAGGCC